MLSLKRSSHAMCRYITGFRDWNDDVDLLYLLRSQHSLDFFSQAVAHVFPAFVHRDAVDYGVRSGEIAKFENVWTVGLLFLDLVSHRTSPFPEDNGLSLSRIPSQQCLIKLMSEKRVAWARNRGRYGKVARHFTYRKDVDKIVEPELFQGARF